jgi:hypothetical protein
MIAPDKVIMEELQGIAAQYDAAGGDLKMSAFDQLMAESDKLQAELWRRAVEREEVLQYRPPELADAIFPQLEGEKWGYININELATQAAELIGPMLDEKVGNIFLDPDQCEKWKNWVHKLKGIDYSWGGYMEDRSIVWAGHYHEPGATIHLGVDFYVPVRTNVHLPVPGTLLYKFQDPDKNGGWGGKLVFDTALGYMVFGHLNNMVLMEAKKHYPKGTIIGSIAESNENGGWSPHLHVQLMRKYDPHVDGYGKKYDGMERDFPNPCKVFDETPM